MLEVVDPLRSLDDDFPDDFVPLPAGLDLLDAKLCQLADTSQKADKAHEDTQFIGHLLIDVKLHL